MFVITIPTYNAQDYIERALESALDQDGPEFRVIVVDDHSTDNTWKAITNYEGAPNLTVYSNAERRGALANHYFMAQLCDDDDVIVNLDGDDALDNPHVLERLAAEYADPSVWLTYGSYEYDKASRSTDPDNNPRGIAAQLNPDQHDRTSGWCTTHLRTYRKWLFDRIRLDDLKLGGDFYQLIPDLAMMFPMVEMAGSTHARYIDDILYQYNAVSPLNEFRVEGVAEHIWPTMANLVMQPIYPQLTHAKAWP